MVVGSAISAGIGWLGANALAVGAVAGAGATAVGLEASGQQRDRTMKQNRAEKVRVATAKAEALQKRKSLIDTQRISLGLGGGEDYKTNRTGETGLANGQDEVLG